MCIGNYLKDHGCVLVPIEILKMQFQALLGIIFNPVSACVNITIMV